jgi:hypothetical protein
MLKKLVLAVFGPALLLLASAPYHPAQAAHFHVFVGQPGYTYPYYPYAYAYPYSYPYYYYGNPYGYGYGYPYSYGWGWGGHHGWDHEFHEHHEHHGHHH